MTLDDFLNTICFIVGQAGSPNTAGPRSIAVSATMVHVVTPMYRHNTDYLHVFISNTRSRVKSE